MSFLHRAKRWLLDALPSGLAGRLRTARVAWLVRGYPRRTVEHRYGIHRLRVLIADPLGAGWYDHDWEDPPELRALRGGALHSGALVFDIGAHQGIVALQLAREVAPAGQVIAVEPNPHNVAVARENVRLNHARVTLVPAAILDRDGDTIIINSGLNAQVDDGSGAFGRVRVATTTIDALAARYGTPGLVMIDVEGAELLALRGARRLLERGTTFVVEVHQGCGLEKLGGSVGEVLDCFAAAGYRLEACREGDHDFRALTDGAAVPLGRFFLMATRTAGNEP